MPMLMHVSQRIRAIAKPYCLVGEGHVVFCYCLTHILFVDYLCSYVTPSHVPPPLKNTRRIENNLK